MESENPGALGGATRAARLVSDWVIPALIGLLAYLLVVGTRAIEPGNIAWLSRGDPATHYLGWVFFRTSDWQFPVGLNPRYGLEISNAIVFSDSVPLLALPLKLASAALPTTFQYFGLWLLACFVAQAWFARRILGLVTDNLATTAIGTALIVFAPPLIARLGGHWSLAGHFFILGALYFAMRPTLALRTTKWTALLMAAALTHAYLLAMAGLIWAIDLADRAMRRCVAARHGLREATVVVAFVAFACWQAGYFSVGGGAGTSGYGFYRMNLLSLIDASGWSYIFGDIPGGGGDYEGFNYLGLGMIFLAVASIWANRRVEGSGHMPSLIRPPLFWLMLGFALFAASNKIGFGSLTLEIPLPGLIVELAGTFRASGRMFWPIYYLICIMVIARVAKGFDLRTAVALLTIGLSLQVADTSKQWLQIRSRLMAPPASTWKSPMSSPFWGHASGMYAKVRRLAVQKQSVDWLAVADYAARNRLATDAAYLARVGHGAAESAREVDRRVLRTGVPEADTLYLLDEGALQLLAPKLYLAAGRDQLPHLVARIDGYIVLAPGWKECSKCPPVPGEINLSHSLPPALTVGQRLSFDAAHGGSAYLGHGWSEAEPWGTWSEGANSGVFLPLADGRATTLLIEANAFVTASHPTQTVTIRINGVEAGSVVLGASTGNAFEVRIPSHPSPAPALGEPRSLWLEIALPDAASPVDHRVNADKRRLGLGLIAITPR